VVGACLGARQEHGIVPIAELPDGLQVDQLAIIRQAQQMNLLVLQREDGQQILVQVDSRIVC